MPFKTDTATVRTIGIDTGKNTLHMIGLDEKGTIVLREKVTRGQIAARLVNAPQCRNKTSRLHTHSGLHQYREAVGRWIEVCPAGRSAQMPAAISIWVRNNLQRGYQASP